MNQEHEVLKRIVNSRSYRSFLRDSSARGLSLDALIGTSVGFLDLDEADKFGNLLSNQYRSRQFLGGASLHELFEASIATESQTPSDLIFEFLESSEFEEVQQVPSTGTGVPVEVGFYRYLQRKKICRMAGADELNVLEHEYRRAVALAISVANDAAFSLSLAGFQKLRSGQWSVLTQLNNQTWNEHLTNEFNSDVKTKRVLYYGGKKFVSALVSEDVIEILQAATHLRFLGDVERAEILSSLFNERAALSGLNRLGLL